MLSKGFEFGEHVGLGIIPGNVKRFPDIGMRIPHIGWNEIRKDRPWTGTILDGIGETPEMYFVHSYYLEPQSPDHSLATTQYGDFSFTSVVRDGNVYGCQFHPEKSGKIGLRIIENFLRLVEESV